MVSKVYGVMGAGLLLLPLMSQAQSGRPQVVPESRINVHFYEVNATNPSQLAAVLVQNAPKVNGKPVLGKASYQMEWQLDTEQLPEQCQLKRVTVTTYGTILLPRWPQGAVSDDPATRRWGRLLSSMFDYESRFKEMVLQGANQVGGAIVALPDHADCEALRYSAWAAGSTELNHIRGRIDAFQRQNGYGAQLGVQWPK